MIYLDHNATTPLRPEARAAMLPCLGDEFGNPSSAHRLGSRARVAVEQARAEVAALIGVRPAEIVFTSGGTESNNLALLGVAGARAGAVVTTPIEHSSVLAPVAALARAGPEVAFLKVDRDGRVDLAALTFSLRTQPALVSIGWANNEIGTIQPIAEAAEICRAAGVPLHVDGVQAVGKIAVSASQCDLMSISAHKLGGPKGVGALFIRAGTRLAAQTVGGNQERGLRAGTENVAGIVGFGVACECARRSLPPLLLGSVDCLRGSPSRRRQEKAAPHGERRSSCDSEFDDSQTVRAEALDARSWDLSTLSLGAGIVELRERLWRGLTAIVDGIERNSPSAGCLPNTLNVRAPGVRGEALVAALDLADIAVSTGSACAAGAAEPSHVLRAIGLSEENARDGLRFSLGPQTTAAEIDRVVDVMGEIVARMRGVARQVAYA